MMMIHRQQLQHPTVEVPPWDPPYDDPTATIFSPQTNAYFSALHKFLPSSAQEEENLSYSETESCENDSHDSFACDEFRMYEFKVRKCARGRSHDWTECPFAHPGEKARRRDPRKFHYSGAACPDFRRGCCRKGDSCEFAHGVFECWLHPARYRTQPCKDGPACQRRVCFFAHTPDQLRVLPESGPSRLAGDSGKHFGISPTSVMERGYDFEFDSPPVSPSYGDSVSELVNSVRGLQIGNMGGLSNMSMSPRSGGGWGCGGSGYGSPRSPTGFMGVSVPIPALTRTPTRSGLGLFDPWETSFDEEILMERVESGKDVRARMYAKLNMENSLGRDRVKRVDSASSGPDFGWVSELVK